MNKRVYKFTSAHYGVCNLQNKRLKLSTIDDLNDPFDLLARFGEVNGPTLRPALRS